jgi:hypothetical protein
MRYEWKRKILQNIWTLIWTTVTGNHVTPFTYKLYFLGLHIVRFELVNFSFRDSALGHTARGATPEYGILDFDLLWSVNTYSRIFDLRGILTSFCFDLFIRGSSWLVSIWDWKTWFSKEFSTVELFWSNLSDSWLWLVFGIFWANSGHSARRCPGDLQWKQVRIVDAPPVFLGHSLITCPVCLQYLQANGASSQCALIVISHSGTWINGASSAYLTPDFGVLSRRTKPSPEKNLFLEP